MSQDTGTRTIGLQPPLPLVDPVEAVDDGPTGADDAEWRLDEHTREVGRRGIAAARARLRSSGRATGARGDGADDRDDRQGDGHGRAPGRAA